jgi:hypothetical protein
MALLNKSKQHHIAVDGKRVTQGLAGKQLGDIDMWGLEGPPSLQQQERKINNFKSQLAKIQTTIDDQLKSPVILEVRNLLKLFTELLKEIRENRLDKSKKLSSLLVKAENNKDKNYQLAISSLKTHLLRSHNLIARCLSANKSICSILANIQLMPYSFAAGDQVDVSRQINMRLLHEVEIVSRLFDVNLHTNIVKQYTQQWTQLRRYARITGSTAHNAIGLRGKPELQQHFTHYVNKLPMPANPPEVQKRMDHGSQNEINGIATLVSTIMPALFPSCALLYEEGLSFMDSANIQRLMAVSPDGYIGVCSTPECCYQPSALFHKPCVVEVKCPFPNELRLPVHYTIPAYYAVQIMAEMKVKRTTTAIYCSYSKDSTTFIQLELDENLWQEIWTLIEELYGSSKPRKQQKVPPYKKDILAKLQKYIEENSQLIAEVPSSCGIQSPFQSHDIKNPYYTPTPPQFTLTSSSSIANDIRVLCANSMSIVDEGFQLLRLKATEILAFIVTDTDRKFSTTIPPHMPLAYAMKGSSLPIPTFREMMQQVRVKCQESGVRILTECFDGQWAMMIMKSQNGKALSRLQLGKDMWKKEKKRKKMDMLKELEAISKVKAGSIHMLAAWAVANKTDSLDLEDLLVYTEAGALNLSSNRQMHKIWTSASHQIWDTHAMKAKKIKAAAQSQRSTVRVPQLLATQNEIDTLKSTFSFLCAEDPMSIYNSILKKLQEDRKGKGSKWQNVTQEALKSFYLKSGSRMNTMLVTDLDCVCSAVKEFSGIRIYYVGKLLKWQKVNILNKVFGDGIDIAAPEAKLPKKKPAVQNLEATPQEVPTFHPKQLQILAREVITKAIYPKEALAAALCTHKYRGEEMQWESKCTWPSTRLPLPFMNKHHEIYWYPELDEYLDELLLRSLDPSHLLTNLRTAITQKGALGVTPADYMFVCEEKVLKRVTIEDNLDQQNVSLAKECFSEKVQKCLSDNGRLDAARVIGIISRWYEACDERGLPGRRRAKHLQEMTDMLTEKINFSHFPPPGNNVQGISLITYEGILQCNSLRLMLYGLCDNGTYNHRAISTLAAESFFSDLSAMEFTTTGCPKAVQIPTLLGQVTQMNKHKHDPEKYFFMELSNKSVYPTHLMDIHEDDNVLLRDESDEYFKSHPFDIPTTKSKGRKERKAFKLNPPDMTARGTRGVRQHYRVDQSKIHDSKKMQ